MNFTNIEENENTVVQSNLFSRIQEGIYNSNMKKVFCMGVKFGLWH
jgi:hypothetical protein